MRQLATIRTISDLMPIPNADKIEVAQVDGWQCVVKKNEFHIGQPIVYIEIDSIVPERPEFEFLRDRKFRVRTIKLRGQVSQGLVLLMSILPNDKSYQVGDDVTEILGIKKYDPEAEKEQLLVNKKPPVPKSKMGKFLMRFAWYRKYFMNPKRKGGFPDWITKTDETRIQNLTVLFQQERDKRTPFSVTEKLDGQSATYFLRRVSKRKFEFGVCSRNIRLDTPDNSSYWTVAKKYSIESVLHELIGDAEYVVLQGEICGPNIQKNKYRLSDYTFYAFNLIYPNKKCSTYEIRTLLYRHNIPSVPILYKNFELPQTIEELVRLSKGKSSICPTQNREGLVVRNVARNISFKVINPDFLLEEKE